MRVPLLLFIVLATIACASQRHREWEEIEFGQYLLVFAVDGTIDEQSFLRERLEVRALNEVVAWGSNDCGEQTGDSETTPEDFPICVEATFSSCTGARSSLAVAVGTFKKGITGSPAIAWATTNGLDVHTLREFAELNPVCEKGAPN